MDTINQVEINKIYLLVNADFLLVFTEILLSLFVLYPYPETQLNKVLTRTKQSCGSI